MNLDSRFSNQVEFTKDVLKHKGFDLNNLSDQDKTFWTKEYALAMIREVTEVLDGIDWKHHRKKTEPIFDAHVKEEMIDLQKFLWGLMAIWGMNAGNLSDEYDRKTFVVEKRWEHEKKILNHPTLVTDLDGVLSEYPDSFLQWVQRNYPELPLLSKKKNPVIWEEMKEKYRMTGGKQTAIVAPGAGDFLGEMKRKGWSIVIFTYRPVNLYHSIEYDTLKWLEDNKMPYDKIFWASQEKSFYISSGIVECDLFIDDDPETCKSVSALGKKVLIRSHNGFDEFENFWNFKEILKNE